MNDATATHDEDRMLEMLADRALDGLSDEESRELDALIASSPGFDAECLDRAAGALAASFLVSDAEPMPATIRRRMDEVAGAWATDPAGSSGGAPAPVAGRIFPESPRRAITPLGALGWFAAAASLALAAILWSARSPALMPSQSSLRSARASLISSAPDLVRVAWTPTEDPAASGGVVGEVVWSDALDRGYMSFKGLAPNDASEAQYQLWVFDESRSADHPVDGGVFDIPAGEGETIIPIDARLPIEKATLFAVTVERPGGVVVSTRERLPVLAKVGG